MAAAGPLWYNHTRTLVGKEALPMLCIGICDDSYDARFALRSALERLLEPRRQTARILEFSSG